jgi:hypothetical protein
LEDEADAAAVGPGEGVRCLVVAGLALFFLKNGTVTASVEAMLFVGKV